ncbi:hypothetical protein LXL04_023079 [Taraxacum kok-saghyz]
MVHHVILDLRAMMESRVGSTLRWASSTLLFEGQLIWEAKAHEKMKHPYFDNFLLAYVLTKSDLATHGLEMTPNFDNLISSIMCMLELISTPVFSLPTNSVSNSFLQPHMVNDARFCPPPGKDTDVTEAQPSILNDSMLFGQLQCSKLLHFHILKNLREVRLLPQLSSFFPKRTKFEHLYKSNLLKFIRNLLAFVSDSHKYLISLQLLIVTSTTSPRYSITPLHCSSLSPEISYISNLETDEATSTRLFNTP